MQHAIDTIVAGLEMGRLILNQEARFRIPLWIHPHSFGVHFLFTSHSLTNDSNNTIMRLL